MHERVKTGDQWITENPLGKFFCMNFSFVISSTCGNRVVKTQGHGNAVVSQFRKSF